MNQLSSEMSGLNLTVEPLSELVALAYSPDAKSRHRGILGMRVLLSAESPPITEIIETGVVNRMVEILQEPMNPANEQLMFETVWALTNIACGTSEAVQTLVDAGVIGIILKAIDFEGEFDTFGATKKDLLTQAIWLLGNVTGDSKTMRDMMLNTGFVENHLIRLSTSEIPVVLARNLAFTFSNCVRGPPVHHSVSFSVVKGILELMGRHHDQEMLLDCIWGLYYASAKGDEVVLDHFVSIGVVDFLSQWMFTNVKEVKTVALKLVASFVSSTKDEHTQLMLDHGFLNCAYKIFDETEKKAVRKEILWMLSNVAAGSVSQIEQLMELEDFIPKTLSIIATGDEMLAFEAVWVALNILMGGNSTQRSAMLNTQSLGSDSASNLLQTLARRLLQHQHEEKVSKVICSTFEEFLKPGYEHHQGDLDQATKTAVIDVLRELDESLADRLDDWFGPQV